MFPDELAAARDRFAGWPSWVRELPAATPADRLIRNDVYHLPQGPPAYVTGRVVLAGDSAHACLPTVGQGAAMALEDAVCVGRMIGAPVRAGTALGPALAAFDGARRPRGRRTVRSAIAGPDRRRPRPGLAAGRPQHRAAAGPGRPHGPVRLVRHSLDPALTVTRWTPP